MFEEPLCFMLTFGTLTNDYITMVIFSMIPASASCISFLKEFSSFMPNLSLQNKRTVSGVSEQQFSQATLFFYDSTHWVNDKYSSIV